jgi:hypothetical protein
MEKFKENDRVKLWLEDNMEPDGGSWCNGTLKSLEFKIKMPLTFIEDGNEINVDDYKTARDMQYLDFLSTIEEWIEDGYKVEKIKTK